MKAQSLSINIVRINATEGFTPKPQPSAMPVAAAGDQTPNPTVNPAGADPNLNRGTQNPLDGSSIPVDDVIAFELNQIALRRLRAWSTKDDVSDASWSEADRTRKNPWDLVGLAFSGGGIRSATFCLGVLQGLASLKMLKAVDYLSTVSGGGYIGSWFLAWIKREGNLENVECQLDPDRRTQAKAERGFPPPPPEGDQVTKNQPRDLEPGPVVHLRQYSNYLAPWATLFSGDSWALLSVYLRNLLANQLCLLPAIVGLMFIVRFLAGFFGANSEAGSTGSFTVLAITACCLVGTFLKINREVDRLKVNPGTTPPGSERESILWISGLTLVSAPLLTWLLSPIKSASDKATWAIRFPSWRWLTGLNDDSVNSQPTATLFAFVFLFGFLHALPQLWRCLRMYGRETNGPPNARAEDIAGANVLPLFPSAKGGFAFATAALISLLVCFPLRDHLEPIHVIAMVSLVLGVIQASNSSIDAESKARLLADPIAGATGGALTFVVMNQLLWRFPENPALAFTLGPPLLLCGFAIGVMVNVAFLGRNGTESEREWWARISGAMLVMATVWTVEVGLTLWGGIAIIALGSWLRATAAVGWIGSAWAALSAGRNSKDDKNSPSTTAKLLSTLAPTVFLVGAMCLISWATHEIAATFKRPTEDDRTTKIASVESKLRNAKSKTDSSKSDTSWTAWFESIGLFAKDVKVSPEQEWQALYLLVIQKPDYLGLLIAIGICFTLTGIASRFVDVNEFSMNALYSNRLVRCYLGASRQRPFGQTVGVAPHCYGPLRSPNAVTGFDPNDDLPLSALRIGLKPTSTRQTQETQDQFREQTYWGPYPLINTALNLVSGDELAWQERLSESFILTPWHYGSPNVKYRQHEFDFERRRGSLGRAVAISGAAANPNMGHSSSPAITALLTIFNVRLGWWFPNPKCGTDTNDRPTFLLKWLLVELFGFTNDKRSFVNLSDGGHFENTAAYELVRRRCRLIIVADCGADPDHQFEDLGNLVRKCRTDFGVEIEIDVERLKKDAATGKSRSHYTIGKIRYDKVQDCDPVGTLLWIKPVLTGDEPADVAQYAAMNPVFPQEPTLDQFFSESQFESYRRLGVHSVSAALSSLGKELGDKRDAKESVRTISNANERQEDLVTNLWYRLRKHWFADGSGQTDNFISSVQPFLAIHDDLSRRQNAGRITRQMYPDLSHMRSATELDQRKLLELNSAIQNVVSAPETFKESAKGLRDLIDSVQPDLAIDPHLALRMFEVMELAYIQMSLERQYAHPLNTGWMSLYQRWGMMDSLRRLWPVLRHEFGREFVAFCERHSALCVAGAELIERAHLTEDEVAELKMEFNCEWSNGTHGATTGNDNPWTIERFLNTGDRLKFRRLRSDVDLTSAGPESNSIGVVAGVITLAETSVTGVVELFVWVRPQFRGHGIGSDMIEEFQDSQAFRDATRVIIRHPRETFQEAGGDIALARWMSFFDFYSFRRFPLEEPQKLAFSPGGFEILALNGTLPNPPDVAELWNAHGV